MNQHDAAGSRAPGARSEVDKLEEVMAFLARRQYSAPAEDAEPPKKRRKRRRVAPEDGPEQIELGKLKGKGVTKLGKGKMKKQVEAVRAERAVGAAPTPHSSAAEVQAALAARV